MHVDLKKALATALQNLDGVTDDIVAKRIRPEQGAAEYGDPNDMGSDTEPKGLEVAKVKVDVDGKPALDGEEVSPQEEEITGDLLEKLKALLSQ